MVGRFLLFILPLEDGLIENYQALTGLDDSLRENTFKRLLRRLASL
jgi:hypothetical protein